MSSLTIRNRAGTEAWLRPAALALLAMILVSAVLDRRNGLSIEMAGFPAIAAAPVVPLTTEELIKEMLTHD